MSALPTVLAAGDLIAPTRVAGDVIPVADQITAEHRLAQAASADAIEHALECGRLLIAQKCRLPHGSFMSWIAENCREFKQAQANAYMHLAKNPDAARKLRAIRHMYDSGRAPRSKRAALPPPSPAPSDVQTPALEPAAPASAVDLPSGETLSIERAIAILQASESADSRRRLKELARTDHLVKQSRRRLERAEIAQRNAQASAIAAARKLQEAGR